MPLTRSKSARILRNREVKHCHEPPAVPKARKRTVKLTPKATQLGQPFAASFSRTRIRANRSILTPSPTKRTRSSTRARSASSLSTVATRKSEESSGPRAVSADVGTQNKQLAERAEALDRRAADLDQREKALKTREAAEVRGRVVLNLACTLEDHCSCSLCFDVMACPYSLSGTYCGHSFCALCLLRWAFTKLDNDIGTWDAPLACPLCTIESSAIPITLPRPKSPFPFLPNRTTDDIIGAMINKLACALEGPEGSESGSRSQGSSAQDPIMLDEESEDPAQVVDWHVDGASRKSWDLRDRRGREIMTELATKWGSLGRYGLLDFRVEHGF